MVRFFVFYIETWLRVVPVWIAHALPCPGALLPWLLGLSFIHSAHQTPILQKPLDPSYRLNPVIPKDFCLLPPEHGYQGNLTFLEDCPTLDRLPP